MWLAATFSIFHPRNFREFWGPRQPQKRRLVSSITCATANQDIRKTWWDFDIWIWKWDPQNGQNGHLWGEWWYIKFWVQLSWMRLWWEPPKVGRGAAVGRLLERMPLHHARGIWDGLSRCVSGEPNKVSWFSLLVIFFLILSGSNWTIKKFVYRIRYLKKIMLIYVNLTIKNAYFLVI